MNYRLRSSVPGSRPTRKYAAFALAALALAVAVQVLIPDISTRVFLAAAAPFWKGGQAAEGAALVAEGVVRSKGSLLRENESLKERTDELEERLMEMQGLEAENAELRSLLGIPREDRLAVASVLSSPPVSPYDTLILEVAESGVVTPGDPIYAGTSVIIGEVAEVHGTRLIGRLYSSAGTEFTATIERNSVSHKAVGSGGGNFEVVVPREVDIAVGDRLMVPGLEPKIVGEVRGIESHDSDSFKRALVRSPVNIFQLKWVTIGRKAGVFEQR